MLPGAHWEDTEPAASTADSTVQQHFAPLDRGGDVDNRVFFADEPTAIAAGFRPCGSCLPDEYRALKPERRTPNASTTDTKTKK